MPVALEITLILVLVALAAALVPLLHQLRRTARGLDLFLLSTSKDLAQIAQDVHASRLRMDLLAGSITESLSGFSAFAKSVGELGSTVNEWHVRFRNTIESASRNIGGLIGGISAALAFFKSKPTELEPE
ncbi:hypothetical protein [Geothrix edaphica]|uniref:DUF948 domain-containing protein n=1 Tax=Geothrix edaphica TaxID=2927976 RepID=A0ABQ5PX12_9BACT|nr:hypothetical protein [Geothrix edaphica]GLH67000.1 hypothetical protein GETHED_13640 [Geothrix edaphica]